MTIEEAVKLMGEVKCGRVSIDWDFSTGKPMVTRFAVLGYEIEMSGMDKNVVLEKLRSVCDDQKLTKEYIEYTESKEVTLDGKASGTNVRVISVSKCRKVGEKVEKKIVKVPKITPEVEYEEKEVEVRTPVWDCAESIYDREEQDVKAHQEA